MDADSVFIIRYFLRNLAGEDSVPTTSEGILHLRADLSSKVRQNPTPRTILEDNLHLYGLYFEFLYMPAQNFCQFYLYMQT